MLHKVNLLTASVGQALFRYPTIGMPDKICLNTYPTTHLFRYPTIGMPDKIPERITPPTVTFRYPTIGMPDKIGYAETR